MIACGALGDPRARAASTRRCSSRRTPARRRHGLADAVGGGGGVGRGAACTTRRRSRCCGASRATGTPPMRALAVLGLGMAHDQASVAEVAAIARVGRLRERGARGGGVRAGRSRRAGAGADAPRAGRGERRARRDGWRSSRWRAWRRRRPEEPAWQREAVQAMADAVFAGADDGDARAGLGRGGDAGGGGVAGGAGAPAATARAAPRAPEVLPVPDGALDVDDAPRRAGAARACPTADRARGARALRRPRPAGGAGRAAHVGRARAGGARRAGQRRRRARAVRGARGDRARRRTRRARIVAALEPSIIPLARHPDPGDAHEGLVLVARSSSDAAVEAVVAGLEDPNEAVQRVALAAVGAAARRRRARRRRARVRSTAVAKISRRTRAGRCACSRRRRWAAWGRGGARTEAGRCLGEAAIEGHLRAGPPGGARGASPRSTPPARGRWQRAWRPAIRSRACARRRRRSPPASLPTRSRLAAHERRPRCAFPRLAATVLAGCRDLSGFNTGSGSYAGPAVPASFVLAGIDAGTSLCLTLDTNHLQDAPGQRLDERRPLQRACRSVPSRRSGKTRSRRSASARAA